MATLILCVPDPSKPSQFTQGPAVFRRAVLLFTILGIVLGAGTAVVYLTFLAAIADNTHPQQRAQSIGVFRLWRDLGYAIGAIVSGIIADLFGIFYSILFIGAVTLFSSLIIKVRME